MKTKVINKYIFVYYTKNEVFFTSWKQSSFVLKMIFTKLLLSNEDNALRKYFDIWFIVINLICSLGWLEQNILLYKGFEM